MRVYALNDVQRQWMICKNQLNVINPWKSQIRGLCGHGRHSMKVPNVIEAIKSKYQKWMMVILYAYAPSPLLVTIRICCQGIWELVETKYEDWGNYESLDGQSIAKCSASVHVVLFKTKLGGQAVDLGVLGGCRREERRLTWSGPHRTRESVIAPTDRGEARRDGWDPGRRKLIYAGLTIKLEQNGRQTEG